MEDGKKTRLYSVVIYDEIKTNTCYEKKTTVKELAVKLAKFCNRTVSRSDERTVERHLEYLKEAFGDTIIIETKSNEDYNPAKPSDISAIYYDGHLFKKTDIDLLSDAVVYSQHLDSSERKRILKNISGLIPFTDNNWALALSTEADEMWKPPTNQLYRNLEYITYAIKEKKCISFDINTYKKRKKLEKNITYQGFTPYRVYLDNGVYYMVGVTLHDKNNVLKQRDSYPESRIKCNITRLEVFRLSHLRMDESNQFFSHSDSGFSSMSIKDIIYGDYDIYNRLSNSRNLNEKAELFANDRGLHVLISNFGEKARIEEVPKDYCKYHKKVRRDGKETLFYITLKQLTKSEWHRLVSLLYQYPISDISLVHPNDKLEAIVGRLKDHIAVEDVGNRRIKRKH